MNQGIVITLFGMKMALRLCKKMFIGFRDTY